MPTSWVKSLIRQSLKSDPESSKESESTTTKELPHFVFKSISLPKPKSNPKPRQTQKTIEMLKSKSNSKTGVYVILGIVAIGVLGYLGYRWLKKRQDNQRESDYWS